MTVRAFTLSVVIHAEPGHLMFDTTALADAVQGALETGITCVIKGVPDVKVPAVYSATAVARRLEP